MSSTSRPTWAASATTAAIPAPLAYDNLAMGINVFEACRELGVEKLVAACSVCAYPNTTPVPFQRGRHLGRIPRALERALRAREEDAARALRRLPRASTASTPARR